MNHSMKDIETDSDIENIVRSFYGIVPQDPVIGAFFTEVVTIGLDTHIPKIVSFWCSILLGDHQYKENVMLKHIQLSDKKPMLKEHFDRWLTTWNNVIDESFEGPKAQLAKSKAQQIALLMQHKINRTSLI